MSTEPTPARQLADALRAFSARPTDGADAPQAVLTLTAYDGSRPETFDLQRGHLTTLRTLLRLDRRTSPDSSSNRPAAAGASPEPSGPAGPHPVGTCTKCHQDLYAEAEPGYYTDADGHYLCLGPLTRGAPPASSARHDFTPPTP